MEKSWKAVISPRFPSIVLNVTHDVVKTGEIKLPACWQHKKSVLRSINVCLNGVLGTDLMSIMRLWFSVLEERDDSVVADCLLIIIQSLLCKKLYDSNSYLAFSTFFLFLPFSHSLTDFTLLLFLNDSSPTKISCGIDKTGPAMTSLLQLCSALFATCLFKFSTRCLHRA